MINPQTGSFKIPQNRPHEYVKSNRYKVPIAIQLNKHTGLVSITRRNGVRQYANATTWSQIRVMQVMSDLITCGWAAVKTNDGWIVASPRRKAGVK